MFERSLRWMFAAAVPALLWTISPGCVPSSGSYCRKVCACAACDDAAEEACVDSLKTAQTNAATRGCGAQYDAYLSCADSIIVCDSATTDTTCSAERSALQACAGDVTFGSPCVNVCMIRVSKCGGGDPTYCAESCSYQDEQAEKAGCATEYNAFLGCELKPDNLCSGVQGCPDTYDVYIKCITSACANDPQKC